MICSCRVVLITIVVLVLSAREVVDGYHSLLQLRFSAGPQITSHRRLNLFKAHVEHEDLSRGRNDQLERHSRRDIVISSIGFSLIMLSSRPKLAAAADTTTSGSLNMILLDIQKARQQMNAVPDLIKNEQWDGVRAILITPPLSDLWTKSARKSSLLQDYANVIGTTPTGDELAVLEAKEDVEGHLRFLDMAVYNNNFNPIKSVGEIGATKALISSYYDDPINEYKATIAALDNLIQLGDVK
jgi:hypothetical protein